MILKLIESGCYSFKLKEIRRVPTFFMQGECWNGLHNSYNSVMLINYYCYLFVGKEYKVLLLSTSEPVTDKCASANPTKSLCNPYVFNTAITRAQSLVVSVGNPFLLLKMEENMVKHPGYEHIGRCWSNYFKCCLENKSMQIASSLNQVLSTEKQKETLMKIKDLVEKQLKTKVQYPV